MQILLSIGLLLLGFIWGVMYDQNMAVLPLYKENKIAQARWIVLKDALDTCTKNKFKSRDYIWDAARRYDKAQSP